MIIVSLAKLNGVFLGQFHQQTYVHFACSIAIYHHTLKKRNQKQNCGDTKDFNKWIFMPYAVGPM